MAYASPLQGSSRTVGRRRISRFIEELVRPHVLAQDLSEAYARMADEEARETDAEDWAESLISDVADEAR